MDSGTRIKSAKITYNIYWQCMKSYKPWWSLLTNKITPSPFHTSLHKTFKKSVLFRLTLAMLCSFEVLYIKINLRFEYQGGHSNLKIALFKFLASYNKDCSSKFRLLWNLLEQSLVWYCSRGWMRHRPLSTATIWCNCMPLSTQMV